MNASDLPVHYHDVVGVAVIIGEVGHEPQEVFRYPFFNEDPARRSLGHFDRIPPKILTKLLKTTFSGSGLSGELLEIVFDDIRLISRPVNLFRGGGDDRTEMFFSLVFVVSSEYYPRRQLYPPSRLPKRPRRKKTNSAAPPPGVTAADAPDEGGGVRGLGEDFEMSASGPAEGDGNAEWGAVEAKEEEALGREEEGGLWPGAAGSERERDHGANLALLRGAVMMVSRAMGHEEWKNGYISREVKHLLDKKDRRTGDTEKFIADMEKFIDMHDDTLYNGTGLYMNFGGRLYGGARQYSPDEMKARGDERWQESVMQENQLAQDVRTLYDGLTRGEPFEMKIKRSSELSINVTVQAEIPATRRYETLILREERHIALSGHPADGSPQIKRMIEIADPHKTLEELAYTSEIELSQMLRLARHLVFWGSGRVIDALCGSNRYQVTREAIKATLPGSPVLAEFSGKFPRRDLMRELTRFGEMVPLSTILEQSKKHKHKTLIAVLMLFLRRDLLVQVHRYVTLAIPEPSSHFAASESEDDEDDDCNDSHDDNTSSDEEDDNAGGRFCSVRPTATGTSSGASVVVAPSDRGAGRVGPGSNSTGLRREVALTSDARQGLGRQGGGGGRDWDGIGSGAPSDTGAAAGGVGSAAAAGVGRPAACVCGDATNAAAAAAAKYGAAAAAAAVAAAAASAAASVSYPSPAERTGGGGGGGIISTTPSSSTAGAAPAERRGTGGASQPAGGLITGVRTAVGEVGGGGGRGSVGGASHGSVVGYAVDAAGNTLVEAPTLEPFEEEYLLSIDDGSEASRLMRRIAPLLRGKLSMREIVWRLEMTSTASLGLALAKHEHILYEVWRPARDPDAA